MKEFSFYNKETGAISGKRISCSAEGESLDRFLADNTPEGFVCIEGTFDRLSQIVDLETKEVIDYIPEQPSADHEWHPLAKRWVYNAAYLAAQKADTEARKEIALLEASQLRPLRELALGNKSAEARIAEIDAKISVERTKLKKPA